MVLENGRDWELRTEKYRREIKYLGYIIQKNKTTEKQEIESFKRAMKKNVLAV